MPSLSSVVRRVSVRATRRPRVQRATRPVRWGSFRRLVPLGRGGARGAAVDRAYVEAFVARHAGDLRGRVLEVGSHAVVKPHSAAVDRLDIVDVDPRAGDATIVADVADEGSLPRDSFDCVVFTQSLQYVRDPVAALRNVHASLVPDGVLLCSVPGVAPVDPERADDAWRFTPVGLARLLAEVFGGDVAPVECAGNAVSATALLHGLAVEDLPAGTFDAVDARCPVVVFARAVKRAS
jgi:SAM-dependent methyltransferase